MSSTASLAYRIALLLKSRGLPEGAKAPSEGALTAEFDVSRQRVREALRYLEALGILQSRQGSGRTLAPQSERSLSSLLSNELPRSSAELLDLLAVRQVLEIGFLPRVIAEAPELSARGMRVALDKMERLLESGEAFGSADQEFHQALFQPLSNAVLHQLLAQFWALFEDFDSKLVPHVDSAATTIRHHLNIIEAVEARDVTLAQFHMNVHFYDVTQVLLASPRF